MTQWLQRAKLWLEWLTRAKFWLIGGVIGALLLLIARVVWHANVGQLLLGLTESIERYGPAAGTVISLIMMWRRAGKKQVNGLAAQVARIQRKLDACEEARAALLIENYMLMHGGAAPPLTGDAAPP